MSSRDSMHLHDEVGIYRLEHDLHQWERFCQWARENNQSALERIYSLGEWYARLLEEYRKLNCVEVLSKKLKKQRRQLLRQLQYTLIDMVSLYNETQGKDNFRIDLSIPD